MTTTRRLLLSAATQQALAGRLPAAVQVCVLEDIVDDDAQQVDAAFISRDITGLSTKHTVQPPLAGCYRVLRRSPVLQWVHTHSAGLDRPIYAELATRGVQVSASSGANAQVVAQTALAGLLMLARQLPALLQAQR
ncbi:MAG: D-2-hydroxyacid dehydrogenase, partial [Rubrivivax sp.]